MPSENLTRDEARERARLLAVDGYDIALDLRSALRPEADTFRSLTTVRFRCSEPGAATFVDLLAPSVESVTLNGRQLDPKTVFDGSRIALDGLAEANVLVVDANCAYGRAGEGMHRFTDPEDGEVYLYTQHEPAAARRVFAAFEQPDLKAPFTFSVTAPANWTVLSNEREAESKSGPGLGLGPGPMTASDAGTREFAPTRPISTYLTAVVAGPYHVVRDHYTRELPDGTVLDIPLAALCRASLARHFDADDILTVTKQGLDFFHENFDYPYPFGKYDQVFVPEHNAGAMENPGCVTLREEFVFRSKVTEAAYEGRANVILHEMAHMWFGDLVTMKWWDDLWLKESFADFMGTFAQVGATRFTDAWVTFANHRKAWAYRADQLPSTHPITADIRDLQDAKLNFDGITYAKGASVLKQLVAYVGQDAFLEGARRYFTAHAYGNAGLADLLSALEATSGRDLTDWSRAWLRTAGVNSLTPRVICDGENRVTELAVLQEAAGSHPELRPHRVAVGLYRRAASGALERYARSETDVTGARTVVAELAGAERPELVIVNDDDLTYCKTRFDPDSLATLRNHLGDVADPLARASAWSAVWNMTRDGLLPARDYIELVLRFAARESGSAVLQSVYLNAGTALRHYAAPEWREEGGRALAAAALRELRAAEPGSGRQLLWARFFATMASSPADLRLLRGFLAVTTEIKGLMVDQELRWAFLQPLAAGGAADESAVAAELARDDTASGKRHQAHCLAARPSAAAKARAWAAVVESDTLPNALIAATISGFAQSGQRQLLAPYTDRYFAMLERIWATRPIKTGIDIVRGLFPAFQDRQDTLDATDAWLAAHADAAPALRRLVLEARDDLARALRAQSCDRTAADQKAAAERPPWPVADTPTGARS
ncbi:aminopeptidase N [Streptomyces murinus]|uniref:aminopeptidase N n=1 Tax=Streptomyces murinus TaxID=33900 RepID=UPI003F4564D8